MKAWHLLLTLGLCVFAATSYATDPKAYFIENNAVGSHSYLWVTEQYFPGVPQRLQKRGDDTQLLHSTKRFSD